MRTQDRIQKDTKGCTDQKQTSGAWHCKYNVKILNFLKIKKNRF